MDKSIYRALLPLVRDKEQMDRLLNYANARIEIARKQLEITRDHHRMIELQGAVAELRRLETLREEVIEGSK